MKTYIMLTTWPLVCAKNIYHVIYLYNMNTYIILDAF